MAKFDFSSWGSRAKMQSSLKLVNENFVRTFDVEHWTPNWLSRLHQVLENLVKCFHEFHEKNLMPSMSRSAVSIPVVLIKLAWS
jgi:hypothetical protein